MNNSFEKPNDIPVELLTPERLENAKEIFEAVKAIFFDVSDTLYSSSDLEKEYPRVLTNLVAQAKAISPEEAARLIQETTTELQKTEKHVTKVRAVRELGLTREEAREAISSIRPHDFLSEDQNLKELLTSLAQKYTLGIISNLSNAHLSDVLNALGVSKEQFSVLITEDLVEQTKPHPEPFVKAIELAGLLAAECIFVGDSPTKDALPAKEQGMLTILVKKEPQPEDLKNADAYVHSIEELKVLV